MSEDSIPPIDEAVGVLDLLAHLTDQLLGLVEMAADIRPHIVPSQIASQYIRESGCHENIQTFTTTVPHFAADEANLVEFLNTKRKRR